MTMILHDFLSEEFLFFSRYLILAIHLLKKNFVERVIQEV